MATGRAERSLLPIFVPQMRDNVYHCSKRSANREASCKLIERRTERHTYSSANSKPGSGKRLSWLRVFVRL